MQNLFTGEGKVTRIKLIRGLSLVVVMQIVDLLMKKVFDCTCSELMVFFITAYFIGPAVCFTALFLALHKKTILRGLCDEKVKVLMYLCPSLYWLAILLTDGKYLACLLNSQCSSAAQNATVNLDLPKEKGLQLISRVSGLCMVFLLSVGYIGYVLYWYCRKQPKDRYKKKKEKKLRKTQEQRVRSLIEAECTQVVDENVFKLVQATTDSKDETGDDANPQTGDNTCPQKR
nr:PREDICTED: uncharacterized protein LOC107076010 [Lepisosteus oculatus]